MKISKDVCTRYYHCAAVLLILTCLSGCQGLPYYIFSGRLLAVILEPGNVDVPLGAEGRAVASIEEFGYGDLAVPAIQDIINEWAEKDLPAWDKDGAKVTAPRILLARLVKGIDIDEANDYLRNEATEAWSESGSTWPLRPQGDYDFTEVPLTAILYKFGDKPDILYPETKDHLLHTLLIESGNVVRFHVPGSLNIVPETENHILMTEGSRYLKNQWLRHYEGETDPIYDNETNGVEDFLYDYIDELIGAGLFEFNSMPYSGYTITALLNLEGFASERLSAKARELLDTIMYKFAVGSLDMRRCVPFRRQPEKAGTTTFEEDDASILARVWANIDEPGFDILPIASRLHQAFLASVMPYRMPDKTMALIKTKDSPYFVQLGRGPLASPEIFSVGSGYLLSAGGVSREATSNIVARPTTLILSDDETDYTNCFHIPGSGDYTTWNNTGVYRNFACGNAPVVVPAEASPAACDGGWCVYELESLLIAVYSDSATEQLGLLVLFPEYAGAASQLATDLAAANPNDEDLVETFVWPDGNTISYDPNAPKGTWAIQSYNSSELDREYDTWPRINSPSEDL
jgi:hypothetical protein